MLWLITAKREYNNFVDIITFVFSSSKVPESHSKSKDTVLRYYFGKNESHPYTRESDILNYNGRFNNNTNTEGYVDENSRGHCISPLLYETGWVPVQISSDNGATFSRDGAWLSGRMSSKLLS